MIIPSFVVKLYVIASEPSPLNFHQIEVGESPFVMEHTAETESSRFNSSSPKVNGAIIGKTLNKYITKKLFEGKLMSKAFR